MQQLQLTVFRLIMNDRKGGMSWQAVPWQSGPAKKTSWHFETALRQAVGLTAAGFAVQAGLAAVSPLARLQVLPG
jgi:hypothetical protein